MRHKKSFFSKEVLMGLCKILGIILALACLESVVAQVPDTLWIARDTTPEVTYYQMFLSDTFPDNRGEFSMVDTGDKIDGKYINFDYQFGHPHPGYAGFKIFWDNGQASYYVADYDTMILWHKGPLPGHKVKMIFAQGSAGCGTPINYECMGEYKSSATWKRESIPFPKKRNYGAAPDSDFVKIGLFELRMLIYNDSSTGTVSDTSPRGDLKIDDMYFLKKSTAIRNTKLTPEAVAGNGYFVPTVSGKVTLAIFSLQGELLFKEPVDVMAGRRYNVGQFARKNSNLPVKWIQCVQISGAGVNISAKVGR
jgi:hypothetical protein